MSSKAAAAGTSLSPGLTMTSDCWLAAARFEEKRARPTAGRQQGEAADRGGLEETRRPRSVRPIRRDRVGDRSGPTAI